MIRTGYRERRVLSILFRRLVVSGNIKIFKINRGKIIWKNFRMPRDIGLKGL